MASWRRILYGGQWGLVWARSLVGFLLALFLASGLAGAEGEGNRAGVADIFARTEPEDGAVLIRPDTTIDLSFDRSQKNFHRYRESLEKGRFAVVVAAATKTEIYLGSSENLPKGEARSAPLEHGELLGGLGLEGASLAQEIFPAGKIFRWDGREFTVEGWAFYDPAAAAIRVKPRRDLDRYTTFRVTLVAKEVYEELLAEIKEALGKHDRATLGRENDEKGGAQLRERRDPNQTPVGEQDQSGRRDTTVPPRAPFSPDLAEIIQPTGQTKPGLGYANHRHDTYSFSFVTGSALGEPRHLALDVPNRKPLVTEGGQLILRVTDDYGQPATRGELQLTAAGSDPSMLVEPEVVRLTEPGAKGGVLVQVNDHKAEPVQVQVTLTGPWPEDQQVGTVDFAFQPGPPEKMDLSLPVKTLPADGRSSLGISGRVADAFGNAVADGTPVALRLRGPGYLEPVAPVTKDGHFTVNYTAGTEYGKVILEAASGAARSSREILVYNPPPPGMVLHLDLNRDAAGTYWVKGKAVDPLGRPVVGALVELSQQGPGTLQDLLLLTDGAGLFQTIYLPEVVQPNTEPAGLRNEVLVRAQAGIAGEALTFSNPVLDGQKPWTDSGLWLAAGQQVTITANGVWAGGLLARVGQGPAVHVAGGGSFIVGQEGELYLGPGEGRVEGIVEALISAVGKPVNAPTLNLSGSFIARAGSTGGTTGGSAGDSTMMRDTVYQLPADGKTTATVRGALVAGAVPVVGAEVSFRLEPANGSLSTTRVVTDENGQFGLAYQTGTTPGSLTIVGSYQQLEGRLPLELTPVPPAAGELPLAPAPASGGGGQLSPGNIGLLTFGGTITSTPTNLSLPPDLAFDGRLDTMWNTGNWNQHTLTRSWPQAVTVQGFNLYVGSNFSQSLFFSLDGSADGQNWVPVVSPQTIFLGESLVVARGGPAAVTVKVPVNLPAPVSFRHLRLKVDLSVDWTNVLEWEIMGTAPPAPLLGAAVSGGDSSSATTPGIDSLMPSPYEKGTDWTLPAYLPTDWGPIYDAGAFGVAPWGRVGGFPAPGAHWIWALPGAAASAQPGTTSYRRLVDLPVETILKIIGTADNRFNLYLDGNLILRGADWTTIGEAAVALSAGRHVLAVEATNDLTVANPAGLLLAGYDLSTGALLFQTQADGSWLTAGYALPH